MPSRGFSPTVTVATSLTSTGLPLLCDTMVEARSSIERIRPTPRTTADWVPMDPTVLGRISMDLIAIGVDALPALAEGDWVPIDYDLPTTATRSGLSQYELLTGLGRRFDRVWS